MIVLIVQLQRFPPSLGVHRPIHYIINIHGYHSAMAGLLLQKSWMWSAEW
ncbi:unnamed protein product [Periconia digitata]|uniref:Uncharacterized protein n=1 Tax=Periconia digitata TaxID=1303443 RepID=A0A9W4UAD2_9PLEO|nr:unnamed protein product [Periconia digitata]